ncbi:MAG: YXWGXW repeat-containing protein, partial [Acidobacteriota bacterium]|nr:YXWGXW repeat-containing protein [Acidobacteriota bacterium]
MTSPRLLTSSAALAAALLLSPALLSPLVAQPTQAQNDVQAGENNGQYTSPPAPPANADAGQQGLQQDANSMPQDGYGSQQDGYAPQQNQNAGQQEGPYAGQNPAQGTDHSNDQNYDQNYDQGGPPPTAPTGINQAPPSIPDYEQPTAPGDGYIWTPGYWAWTSDGYEWVQGAWVSAPYTGALWTPGYWGYSPYGYFWNAGYWGPEVGYYGDINYGFGYFGVGFYGGYWGGGQFWYNRSYCNLGYGDRGYHVYQHPYNGYSGRPGGTSYVRANFTSRGGGAYANNYHSGFRGSTINGRGFTQSPLHGDAGQNRGVYHSDIQSSADRTHSFAQLGNQPGSHPGTQTAAQSGAPRQTYTAPSGTARPGNLGGWNS